MGFPFPKRRLPGKRGWWLLVGLFVVVVGLAVADRSLPEMRQSAATNLGIWMHRQQGGNGEGAGHDESESSLDESSQGDREHDHAGEAADDHAGENAALENNAPLSPQDADHKHEEAAAVKLSPTAQENVGLQLGKVELRVFERTITVPAMVVERPGRSAMQVAAPLTGVVTRIWPLQGETVTPGQPLFDLRLMHEEVVEAQAEFLRTTEELDVINREIVRLEKVAQSGAIAGKTLLERQYEQQKAEGNFRAQRQRLLLHGLSASQVDEIVAKRTLLGKLTVVVPDQFDEQGQAEESDSTRLLQIEELKVTMGQYVKAGDPLCVLTDHARLYIQGKAFEQDAAMLEPLANHDGRVTAVVEGNRRERQLVPDLPVVYLANKIEPESRAYLFYVELPNQVVRNEERPDGHRFSSWQFKPGQRVELLIPAERWNDRIVLPLDALVQDGAETYVFEQNDGHFDRRVVRVEYRDQYSAVIANDGALLPGKMVVVAGTYQVHLSMKNKAGGAPDPHAGHNH